MRSAIKRAALRWLGARARTATVSRGVIAVAVLGVGRHSPVIVISIFVLVLIPILGFTLGQFLLTMHGRRKATSVEDIRSLKLADATAFTWFFAAIIRKLWAVDVSPEPALPPANEGAALPGGEPVTLGPGRDTVADGFLSRLEPDERAALIRVARLEEFDKDVVLWRQDDYAASVLIVKVGWVLVLVSDVHGERPVAIRQQDDIVGERAALRADQRSATVVTISKVQAYVVTTSAFVAVAARYPRIVKVVEDQIYDRLTERPFAPASAGIGGRRPLDASLPRAGLPFNGENCSIFLVDVSAFTDSARTDPDRREVRTAMYAMLRDAFNAARIPWLNCHCEDRGDGALIIVPSSTPTNAVIQAAVMHLAPRLHQYNRSTRSATTIVLRVAVSVGPVVTDPHGVSGHAINQAARLIEANTLKAQIRETSADLGLVVSPFVYETVISQHVPRGQLSGYRSIEFSAKGAVLTAWMYLSEPGHGDHRWPPDPMPDRPAA